MMAHSDDEPDVRRAELAVRRRRSVVMALALAGLAIIFFITTIVRLGGDVALRDF